MKGICSVALVVLAAIWGGLQPAWGAPATQLVVSGITTPRGAEEVGSVTVEARDGGGLRDTGYTGTVHFTSSDPNATLPPDYTFTPADGGIHTFSSGIILRGVGSRSVTATDTVSGSITGGQGAIAVAVAPAPFAAKQDYATGSQPYSVTGGDFNGDGKADLAVANAGGNTVSVLLGNGDGSFQAKMDYATGSLPWSVTSGDFNGDGKADLTVANRNSDTVSVFLGNGDGSFQAKVDYATGSAPWSITSGDFNADGKADLAVANYGGNTVSVLLGNGNGTFQANVDYATDSAPLSVTSGDFNADGKIDLAVANRNSNTVSVLLGNGDGTFQTKVDYATGGFPNSVTSGDFNADGKADLAVANNGSPTVSVLLGNGDGSFQGKVDYATGGGPYSVTVSDFNADGSTDLAVANDGSGTISVLLGNGNGTFQGKVDYITGISSRFIISGDINGDSKADLAVANGGSTVSILLNTTPPAWSATYPLKETVTTSSISLLAKSPKSGTAYLVALPSGSAAPSAARVKAGQDAAGTMVAASLRGSASLLASGEATLSLSGLPAGTGYDLHLVMEDSFGVLQPTPYRFTLSTPVACGLADGVAVVTAPTADLCDGGTPTAVTGSGPWNWQCVGTDNTASCSAPELTWPLTVDVSGIGTVTAASPTYANQNCTGSCAFSYRTNAVVTLTPSTDASHAFSAWSGDCTGSGGCSVTMDGAKAVTATFIPKCAPMTLSAPASSSTGVYTVSWSAGTAGASYTLYENGLPVYTGTDTSFVIDWRVKGLYSYSVTASKEGYADSDPSVLKIVNVTLPTCGVPASMAKAPDVSSSGSYQVYWLPSGTPNAEYELTENGITVYTGPAYHFNVTGKANGTYTYQVRAIKKSYTPSAFSESTSVSVTLTCSIPVGPFTPPANTSGTYQVFWNFSSTPDATYTLYENGTAVYTGKATSFNVTGKGNGVYTYKLKVTKDGYVDSVETATASTTVTLTCAPPVGPFVPPTSISGNYQVFWSYSSTPDVIYTLYENGTAVYTGKGTSYNVTGKGNGVYTYKLKVSRDGYVDSVETATASTTVTLTCAKPVGPVAPPTSVSGNYQVYWSFSSTPDVTYTLYENGTAVYTGKATSYNVTGKSNGSYAYKLKVSKDGYVDSGETATVSTSVTLTCTLPVGPFAPPTNTSGNYQVFWNFSSTPDATYTLYENGSVIYTGKAISFNVTGRGNGVYAYKLKVSKDGYVDSVETASVSTTVTLTVAPPAGSYAPASNTSGKYKISWVSSRTPKVVYTLYENGTAIYTGKSTSFKVKGRGNGSYTYQVKAIRKGYVDSQLSRSVTTVVAK